MADNRRSVGFPNNGKDARRRTLIIQSPKKREAILDDSLLIENEDAIEKKKNRKSLVLTSFNSKTPSLLSSPRSTMKPLSTAPRLDSDQLQQHYSDCIKLSTENKINAKNAFGLHLLEYIETIISEKSDNFQVVGCTIDAGAKIYAGRVDAVHSDMLKMVGSITADAAVSSSRGSNNDDLIIQEDGEDGEFGKKKKKKKLLCEGRTIEKSLANIRQNFYDLSFDVDPLLQKSARQSDEQCSAALISYNTPMNNGQLLFDSSAILYSEKKSIEASPVANMAIITLPSSFCWPLVEPFTLSASQESIGGVVEPVVPGIETTEEDEIEDETGGCLDNSDIDDDQPLKKMTIDQLALALEPSEYGYFNPRLGDMWAGPAHWKLKPVLTSKDKGERKKKVAVVHAFNQTPNDLVKHFIKARAKTTLANETIRSNQLSSNILPVDIRYAESNLRRVSMLPLWRGHFVPSTEKIVSSGGGEGDKNWYNYENPHDTSNYCPNTTEVSDSDDGVVDFSEVERHGGVIGGIELIEAAPTFERIHINYAKIAKKIDIKILKAAIWSNLSIKSESVEIDAVEIENKTFSQTYKNLPNRLSESVVENLSVPIAFSCLLHLANEHGLTLLDKKNFSDIHILFS